MAAHNQQVRACGLLDKHCGRMTALHQDLVGQLVLDQRKILILTPPTAAIDLAASATKAREDCKTASTRSDITERLAADAAANQVRRRS